MDILLLSDIHGNYPALMAIESFFADRHFAMILNGGDSVVYAPFPAETLRWLREHGALSILGNTDKKVLKLLSGKKLKKPGKKDKRVMYTATADQLDQAGRLHLQALPVSLDVNLPATTGKQAAQTIGLFHGSPAQPHEFLFSDTPDRRFEELAADCSSPIVVTGHSHSPYHKLIGGVHFINPGSAGRMFDGDPRVSCAVLRITDSVSVEHFRIAYDIEAVVRAITGHQLPDIYVQMYREGRKLN